MKISRLVGHWAIAQTGWSPVELGSEPLRVIIHLHDMVGIPLCSWNSGSCLSYHPHSPHKRSLVNSHVGNGPSF